VLCPRGFSWNSFGPHIRNSCFKLPAARLDFLLLVSADSILRVSASATPKLVTALARLFDLAYLGARTAADATESAAPDPACLCCTGGNGRVNGNDATVPKELEGECTSDGGASLAVEARLYGGDVARPLQGKPGKSWTPADA
jgi:hypothetical protein